MQLIQIRARPVAAPSTSRKLFKRSTGVCRFAPENKRAERGPSFPARSDEQQSGEHLELLKGGEEAKEAFIKMIGALESVDAGHDERLHELEQQTVAIAHASLLDADDPIDFETK